MSRKFFRFFALVAIFTLALAGSTLAAERTWRSDIPNGSWSAAGNWVDGLNLGIPTNLDIAVFPNSAREISIESNVSVGAIRIDSGTNEVKFNISAGTVLEISADLYNTTNPAENTFTAKGNAIFTGQGRIGINTGNPVAGSPADPSAVTGSSAVFNVYEGKTLQFDVLVSADNDDVVSMDKLGKGTLSFTATQDNKFNPTGAMSIRDGEVAIGRAGHINGTSRVVFDTQGIQGRTATLTTLWSTPNTFNQANKIFAETNGTIKVTDGPLVLGNSGRNPSLLPIVQGVVDRTITKSGAGSLLANASHVWMPQLHVNIAEGEVAVQAEDAFETNWVLSGTSPAGAPYYPPYVTGEELLEAGVADTNVTVASGAKLSIKKNQAFGEIKGTGNIAIDELYFIYVTKSSVFDGVISGYGGVKVTTNALAYGAPSNPLDRTILELKGDNTYEGDTVAIGSTLLAISGANNVGGKGKIYLRAREVGSAVAGDQIEPSTAGAFYAQDNMALHNEFYVDAVSDDAFVSLTYPNVSGSFNKDAATIIVPMDTRSVETPIRLEIAGNVTYAYNSDQISSAVPVHRSLQKYKEGLLVLSAQGYRGKAGNVAMYIENGTVRVTENLAFGLGDVWVGPGTASKHPRLSAKNGLNLKNNVYFDKASGFSTELKEENKTKSGKVAVMLGDVTGTRDLTPSVMDVLVDFDSVKSVAKSDVFRIFETRGMNQYEARNVKPTVDNAIADKAPFDPYISTLVLEFEAQKAVDVPEFGALNPSVATPGTQYSGSIEVESQTGLKVGSAKVTGLSWLAATISGNKILLSGKVPDDFEGGKIDVSVTTEGNLTDEIVGYASTRYDYAVTPGSVSEGTLTGGTMTTDATGNLVSAGQEVTFSVGAWKYTDPTGAVTDDAAVTYALGTPGIDGPGSVVTNNLAIDGTMVIKVADTAAPGATVKVTVAASYSGASNTSSTTLTVDLPVDESMAVADPNNPEKIKSGAPVVMNFTIDTDKFDRASLQLIAPSTDWKIEWLSAAGTSASAKLETFRVVGTMPAQPVTYYFTADNLEDSTTYKTGNRSLALDEGGGGGGSSGGCDAGFAGLALLLAAPLFLRKRA